MSLSGDLASDQRSGAQQEDAPGRISMERRLPIFRLACVCFEVVVGHAGPIWEMPAFAVPTMLFPTDLASFLDLIRQHGDAAYSFMFAYAASHSLLLTLFAGYAAHSGALSFGTLIVVCGFGSFTGDVVRFWIGRRFGKRLLGSFPRLARTVQTAAQLAHRHHVWMILLHRYPHGIRGVAAFAYGMSPLPWSTFLVLNFVAAAIWSCAVVSAGYAFGQVSEKVMSDASSGLGFVMLCAFLGLSWFLSRRLERVLERS